MTAVTEDEVLDALSSVIEPENDEDIITLQMVRGLVIKDGNVGFTLEVDQSRGEAMEPVRQAAEAAVNKIPGVLSVTAVLTAHNTPQQSAPPQNGPAGPSGNVHGAGPSRGPQQEVDLAPDIKHIVAVASGKGGVGVMSDKHRDDN